MTAPFHRAATLARAKLREPRVCIALAFMLICGLGMTWGLPASDGWDNDGIAPRDFLPGLIDTYRSGSYFTYPPLHLWIVAVLTAPVSVVAFASAHSASPAEVVSVFTQVEYMTAFALVARALSLVMAGAIVAGVGGVAEELTEDPAVGTWASLVAALDVCVVYYAHTSNLDVPYLFWLVLSVRAMVRAAREIAAAGPRAHVHARWAIVFALCAMTSKDQAYAACVLSLPAVLLPLAWTSRKTQRRALAGTVLLGAAATAFAFGVLEAAFFNGSGFQARIKFLSGSASQDFVDYSADIVGRLTVVRDVANRASFGHPLVWIAPLLLVGFVVAFRRGRAETSVRLACAVPALAAVSFVLFFNCVARRTDHRFVMPVYVLLAPYAGMGARALAVFGAQMKMRVLGGGLRGLVWAGAAWAGYDALAVCANLALDPRYDAEAWLRAHVQPGDTVEVYGLNVYLPRLPRNVHATRVSREVRRNPMPGLEELNDSFGNVATRNPKYIVVCGGWVWRYLQDEPSVSEPGRVMPPTQAALAREADGTTYFRGLLAEKLGYRVAYRATFDSRVWRKVDIHGSVARDVIIFERANPN